MRTVDGRLPWLRIEIPPTSLRRHSPSVAEVRVCRVGRHEGLRLRGDGSEYTFLLEPLAVGATTVIRRFETGAPNLSLVSRCTQYISPYSQMYLAPPAISACDSCPLPWCRLTLVCHVWRRYTSRIWGIGSIHVVRRIHPGMWMVLRVWRGG